MYILMCIMTFVLSAIILTLAVFIGMWIFAIGCAAYENFMQLKVKYRWYVAIGITVAIAATFGLQQWLFGDVL